jgi:hypothetical protein
MAGELHQFKGEGRFDFTKRNSTSEGMKQTCESSITSAVVQASSLLITDLYAIISPFFANLIICSLPSSPVLNTFIIPLFMQ